MKETMRDEVILCLAYSFWDFWRTDSEEMSYLSNENKIIYVEKQENAKAFNTCFPYIKFFQPLEIRAVKDNISVISAIPRLPLGAPMFRFPEKLAYISIIISKWILRIKIKRTLKRMRITPTILWCYEPWDLLLAGHFGEKRVCYRVYDEVALFPGIASAGAAIEKLERKLLKKASVIFTTSSYQYSKRKRHHPNTHFIPHGCDFNLYNEAIYKNLEKPEDIKHLNSSIIGFVGNIDHRIDWDLIIYLCKKRPHWSILFIGRVENIPELYSQQIKEMPNILLLGQKSPDKIPAYLKCIDVSIMPYLVTGLLSAAFPRKLHEHFAAGKPIVSTRWPEVLPYENLVGLAKNKEEFLLFIEEELLSNTVSKVEKRVNLARKNSLENQMNKMAEIINAVN